MSQGLGTVSPPELERAVLTCGSVGPLTPSAPSQSRGDHSTRVPHSGGWGHTTDPVHRPNAFLKPFSHLQFISRTPASVSESPQCQCSVFTGESMSIPLGGAGRRTVCPRPGRCLTGPSCPPTSDLSMFYKEPAVSQRLQCEGPLAPACEPVLHSSTCPPSPQHWRCTGSTKLLISVSAVAPPPTLSFTRVPLHLQHQPVPTQHVVGAQETSELVSNSAADPPCIKLGYLQPLRARESPMRPEGKSSVSRTWLCAPKQPHCAHPPGCTTYQGL